MSHADGLHSELTHRIIGAARRVYAELGQGFLEKVYQNALVIELRRSGMNAESSVGIEVRYRGDLVGVYEADVLVNSLVILELKAIDHLAEIHEVQLVNYLRATPIEVGLLLNFGPEFEIRRRIYSNDRKKPRQT